jgi:hypothetical protein
MLIARVDDETRFVGKALLPWLVQVEVEEPTLRLVAFDYGRFHGKKTLSDERGIFDERNAHYRLKGHTVSEIPDDQVEWAVVSRLRAMLEALPKTEYNVTQSFALFSSILLWTKNRAWVPKIVDDGDRAAKGVRDILGSGSIFDPPWLLSQVPPNFVRPRHEKQVPFMLDPINGDFEKMIPEQFIKWLRDALAHGDGRTIKPIHPQSTKGDKTWLVGFEIVFPVKQGSQQTLNLSLYHSDMRRIGVAMADIFCRRLSGGNKYLEKEAGSSVIENAA